MGFVVEKKNVGEARPEGKIESDLASLWPSVYSS